MNNIQSIVVISHLMLTFFAYSDDIPPLADDTGLHPNVIIDEFTQDEINRRLHVTGAMGNNITLINGSPIGIGTIGFVLAGETVDHIPVAIKFSKKFQTHEYECYTELKAMTNKTCEKYGVPFIYNHGKFLHFHMLTMTRLDTSLEVLLKNFGPFSKDNILIIARDMIKILKFIHSNGVIHVDIKPPNIMVKGANVFLCDFNLCDIKASDDHKHGASMYYGAIAMHFGWPLAESDDLQSLYYVLLTMADVRLPWMDRTLETEVVRNKLRAKEVESLLYQVKYAELIEPYAKFYTEMRESSEQKRLPRYDYLYRMFDDALYAGRDRSKRIVFDWLTPEEKAKAMTEDVPSIESIVFPKISEMKKSIFIYIIFVFLSIFLLSTFVGKTIVINRKSFLLKITFLRDLNGENPEKPEFLRI